MEINNQQSLSHGYHLKSDINEYIIDRVLGQGAFGITYLARYRTTIQGAMGRGSGWTQVAIKEFFMKDMNSRDGSTGYLNDVSRDSLIGRYRRAFMREARNLAGLHHDNIVNVFEVIEANNTVYIVMEYINGGSLDDHITQAGHLSERETIDKMLKLCSAVGCLHNNKMLHLDIKPKNVMLDEDGELYLIDFGLSKQYTADGEPESSTSIGLGTPGYAPVEQAEHQSGDKSFRATLDVYALGATMYKMLTGQTPPKASRVSDSTLDGDNIIPKLLKESGVSDDLVAIVTKAMWPSSSKRYQNISDFVTAIGALLKEYGKGNTYNKPIGNDETIIDQSGKDSKTAYSSFSSYKSQSEKELRGAFIDKDSTVFEKSSRDETIKNNYVSKKDNHEYVDLGLSVKWATCNMGAVNPEDNGEYYAWGETVTKKKYTEETYRFITDSRYNKYNDVDKKEKLELTDDVARCKWGGSWRMPTNSEFQELIDNCIWTWTVQNGIKGCRVTSKKPGYNGRSIFLPAAGCHYDKSFYLFSYYGFYWSSSLGSNYIRRACSLRFDSEGHSTNLYCHCMYFDGRHNGFTIRPVFE